MTAARARIASLAFLLAFALTLTAWGQVTFDIATDELDFTVFSRDGKDALGSQNTLALGDFNNDRKMDLLIGSPGGDGPDDRRTDAGEAYIIYGRDTFPPELNADGIPGPDVIMYGRDFGDLLGSGAAAGDVNGDGIDDIILGAPGGNGPSNGYDNVGEVIVIYGGLQLPARMDLAKVDENAIIFNGIQNSRFGSALEAADMNGDGIDDIAIADPYSNMSGKNRSGSVFIVFGRSDFPERLNVRSGVRGKEADVRIFGADRDDQIGTSLSKGDVNLDGMEDLVIGAPYADGPGNKRKDGGEAYVIYGSFNLPEVVDLAATSADITIYGGDPQDQLGRSVDAGDVNGDKVADLLIGAPLASGLDNLKGFSGEAYIIYGKVLLPSIIDLNEKNADSRILGAAALDNLGSSVNAADLNDDGYNDLILGAEGGRGPDGGRARAGNVYVLRSPGDLPPIIDLGENEFSAVIFGAETGDNLGSALAGGDLGGKGKGFLLIGASGVDSPADGPDAGAVYAIFARELVEGPIAQCKKGDVDCDGKITIIDARIVCEMVLGTRVLTEKERRLADVAEPFGEITLADAFKIAQVAVGIGTIVDDTASKPDGTSGAGLRAASLIHIQKWAVLQRNQQVEFRALGSDVESVKVHVFGLNGSVIFDSSWVAGSHVLWAGPGTARPLANGLYLFVIEARSFDGRVTRSEVQKVVILR